MSRIINPIEYLIKSAEQYPDRIAIKDNRGAELSYKELKETVSKIGTAIFNKTEGIKHPVIVLCERNVESLLLILGTVWAGDFYVPLDAKMPETRLAKIKETLENPIVIKGNKNTIEELLNGVHNIETPWEEIIDQDLLYIIFTSGSTGTPKGVTQKIASVLDMVDSFSDTFDFPKEMVTGNQAPFDFDVSEKDIWLTISHGGTIVIIPQTYFSMPGQLIPCLKKSSVNTLIWAVSALRIVENFNLFEDVVPDELRLVMFSGETMQPRTMRYWQKNLPKTTFVNLYGPTEITCNCTYFIVDREYKDNEKIPIGKAFRNCVVEVCDSDGKKIKDSSEGEICVRGICVAAGYYGEKEKTEKVFKQDASHDKYRDVVYHTGDLGKYDSEGNIIFCGRSDHQIKHMGHRIELGEIESAVSGMSEINISCAVFHAEKDRIVLFYECKEDIKNNIIDYLKNLLPKYMIPNDFVRMDKIPQTVHAKCDRVLLKKMLENGEI